MNPVPMWRLNPTPWPCKLGWHCALPKLVYRFNGGNGAWTCSRCNLILAYGHIRPATRKELRT